MNRNERLIISHPEKAGDVPTGQIVCRDLTVRNPHRLLPFYHAVAGWDHEPVPAGSYNDFLMHSHGQAVASIRQAAGSNAGLPSQWLDYIVVPDVGHAQEQAVKYGGHLIRPLQGSPPFCVIADPSGAIVALWQHF